MVVKHVCIQVQGARCCPCIRLPSHVTAELMHPCRAVLGHINAAMLPLHHSPVQLQCW